MGNTSSNVTSGVKKQADAGSLEIYKLINLAGGGELVDFMKNATKNKKSSEEIEEKIYELVLPFLYNNGEGKLMPVSELVLMRNKECGREKQLQGLRPEELSNSTDLNGATSKKIDMNKHRLVCWKMDQRGAVGETLLHMCLLNASSVHADLAKRLIKLFPKLISDYYISDEYYGEATLHMAIVNEDLPMVKFLLDNGADFHGRCFGSFFSPEDQKNSREDTLDHEWVGVCTETNYEGYVYWGEYPLAFAACLGQEECYRLTLAKGADPDLQDTNGNTVLHMLVIHENLDTFNMAFELGASMDIKNAQGLTALTLAAKLARKSMFFHILNLEREVYWQLGGIVCAAYPLQHIDTVDTTTGEINNVSALNLIVYGEKEGHIDMMDGMIMDLLNAKWNSFVKFRFYKSFALFCLYFIFSMASMVLREGPGENEDADDVNSTQSSAIRTIGIHAIKLNTTLTGFDSNMTLIGRPTTMSSVNYTTSSDDTNPTENINPEDDNCLGLFPGTDNIEDLIRIIAEPFTVVGAVWYLVTAAREASFLGYYLFMESLKTVPSRILFLVSCMLVVVMVPLRVSCLRAAEDIVAVFVMITTAPYFLFFCRGFKIVGPFVVMVYKMIVGDLLRFVAIYLVFVLGFSQAFYVIFLTHWGCSENNFFRDPIKSVVGVFVMSLQEFQDMYDEFDKTNYPLVAKILFIIYMGLVAILLVNMLIAMMGNTYQIIAEVKNEWQRQWARIVLVVERGVSPKERLQKQTLYSQPMADGRKAFVVRIQLDEKEKNDIKTDHEMKITHIKNAKRKAKGSNILATPTGSSKRILSDPVVGTSCKRWEQVASGGNKLQAVGTSCKRWEQVASGGNKLQAVGTSCKRWEQVASGGNKLQAERTSCKRREQVSWNWWEQVDKWREQVDN
uniref:Ion transport domain-containing protein n=1 Tax=Strigamia maritima TaxID=126957 RepID=T1IIR8_STRMM